MGPSKGPIKARIEPKLVYALGSARDIALSPSDTITPAYFPSIASFLTSTIWNTLSWGGLACIIVRKTRKLRREQNELDIMRSESMKSVHMHRPLTSQNGRNREAISEKMRLKYRKQTTLVLK